MSKNKSIVARMLGVFATLVFALLAACSSGPKSTGKIVVGTQPNSAGTSYLDEKGNLTGFEIDLLKEIDKKIPDVEFEFKTMDFGSLFNELSAKKVDIINANLQYNKDRAEKYLYSNEILFRSAYKVVVNQSDNTTKSIKDLDGKKISVLGVGLQFAVLKDLIANNHLNIEILPTKTSGEAIELVKDGRADAVFLPEHQAIVFTKYKNIPLKAVGSGYIPKGLNPDQVGAHYLFDKSNTALRDKVDKAVAELRADGTLKRLSDKWFGVDFSKPIKLD